MIEAWINSFPMSVGYWWVSSPGRADYIVNIREDIVRRGDFHQPVPAGTQFCKVALPPPKP